MPAALGLAANYIAGFFYGVGTAAGLSAGAAATFAVGATNVLAYATNTFLINRALASLEKRPNTGEARSLEGTYTDTAADGMAIYGRVRVGGVNVIPPITGGEKNPYLEQILALAIHEIDGYRDTWFDTTRIPRGNIGSLSGDEDDGKVDGLTGDADKYNGKAWIRRYTGTASQTVDWILNNRYPTRFTSDFRGRGIPYLALTYDWAGGGTYDGGGPPQVAQEVLGKRCYDPRLDSSPGTAPDSFHVFDSNPATQLADYMRATFGGGIPAADVDWDSVVTAASVCDTMVVFGPGYLAKTASGGAISATGQTIEKTAGTSVWTEALMYSQNRFTHIDLQGAFENTTQNAFFGLHSEDPDLASPPAINHAWHYSVSGGALQVFEDGVSVGTFGAYTPGVTSLRIVYDGEDVLYIKDGVTVHSSTNTGMMHIAVAIFEVGMSVTLTPKQKRYTCNGRLQLAGIDWRDNAVLFVDAMMGSLTNSGGKWYMRAGSWDVPQYTIEQTDWLSIGSIKTVQPRNGSRWNGCKVWYLCEEQNWQRKQAYARFNDVYKADDAGERIWLEMEQPMCLDEFEAQRKGEFLLRQSRNQIKFTGRLGPKWRKLRPGMTVALNFTEGTLNWVSKTFRIAAMDLLTDGSVNVSLTEEQLADWTDLTAAEYGKPSVSTMPTSNPTAPTAPASFTVNNNINGTLGFVIGTPIVKPRNTHYQIIRSLVSTNAAVGTVIYDGFAQRVDLVCPTSLHWYFARAVAENEVSEYIPNTMGNGAIAGLLDSFQVGTSQITELANAFAAGPITTNVFVDNFASVVAPAVPIYSMILVTISGVFRRVAIGPSFTMRIVTGAITGEAFNVTNTVDQMYTMQFEHVSYANSAQTIALRWDTNTTGGVVTGSNIRVRAHLVKR